MQNLTLKQKRAFAQNLLEKGATYQELDKFCAADLTQNRVSSDSLSEILSMIYVGSGKIPVFHEERIQFEATKYPVAALPSFMRFKECPVANIPGHKKDREIFESFYPILDDNLGMYFRIALAWLAPMDHQLVAVLLHVSNRDFDQMSRLKIYVPVITNMDTRMDIVAMSYSAFVPMMLAHQSNRDSSDPPRYFKFDPRSGARMPTETKETLPPRAIEQAEHIRNVQYPEFYEKMLAYVRDRHMSPAAYTCGQFLLDVQMRN